MALEVAITSDSSGQMCNCCIWNLQTGNALMSYKGGISGPKTLNIIDKTYLISAFKDKKILNVWGLNRREQQEQKMVCPGKVTAVAVSPDGNYCAVGIEEKIHIWQLASGCLLSIVGHHFQQVTCIQFTEDSTTFVSAAKDCLLLAWNMFTVLDDVNGAKPFQSWSNHSLPIEDICVGMGKANTARVVSVSADQTCKIYEIGSGQLLLSIMFDSPLHSVTMDTCEYHLYIGSGNGDIYRFDLFDPPRTVEHHHKPDEQKIYKGHRKCVTSLSVSMDGNTLLSGSDDGDVRLWDVNSLNCTSVLAHKAPITNAFITLVPSGLFNNRQDLSGKPLAAFKRHLYNSATDDNDDEILLRLSDCQVEGIVSANENDEQSAEPTGPNVKDLHKINEQLYLASVNYILQNPINK